MPLSVGDRLGPYEILALIGAGGMGEVYRARDTRLKREVAIKILPDAFARDPERMVRFQREAETLASLNHPNIAAIYGVEDRALVMELVEGNSPKGPLAFDEAWHIASQIAEALEYAHDKGVVHRDLKPANVKITPEGVVKLLDFGLAKAFSPQGETAAAASGENSPTLTIGMTEAGMILGTAAYMAPEQARGRPVDKRVDIWAFGVVLHEMLTGERLFEGEDVAETLAAVIHKRPDLEKVPAKVRPLIESCLEKDPRRRLKDIGDAERLLGRDSDGAGSTPVRSQSRFGKLSWIAAGAFAVAVLALGFVSLRHAREEPLQVTRFEIHAPEGSKLPLGTPAPSPDGRTLAYTVTGPDGITRIYIRRLDSTESHALPGTEDAIHPFWSPDGRSLAFVSNTQLKRIDLAAGSARSLTDVAGPWHGTWNQDRIILFEGLGVPYRITSEGGATEPVVKPNEKKGEANVGFPEFLRDGKRFLVRVGHNDSRSSIELATLGSLERNTVIEDALSAPILAPIPGGKTYLLYLREPSLMAQEFDEPSGTIRGDAQTLIDTIGTVANPAIRPAVGISATGLLAYQKAGIGPGQLAWFDRSGKMIGVLPAPATGDNPRLSPDGQFAAIQKNSTIGNTDIWITDLARGASTRFTFAAGASFLPVWSPDGKRIVFRRATGDKLGIYEKDTNGVDQEHFLTPGADSPLSWSPDGHFILCERINTFFLLPLDGGKPIPVGSVKGLASQGRISPDGRYMAFANTESGRNEVYVQSLPPATGRWQISVNGGGQPRWRGDGKELFFLSLAGKMMVVDMSLGTTVAAGVPRELFQTAINSTALDHYDVSRDGQKFLIYSPPGGIGGNTPITVVLNWWLELKK